MHKIVMEITLLFMKIMEKSWNCIFEFLWEPCLLVGHILIVKFVQATWINIGKESSYKKYSA